MTHDPESGARLGDKFTAKNYPISTAPKRIELLGEKTQRPEPAQHIIEFPGGAVEVSRTSDGNYWAHILVHQEAPFADGSLRVSARGEVLGSRVATSDGLTSIDGEASVTQIAVLVRPVRGAA